jgi:integrase/recombinase XerD
MPESRKPIDEALAMARVLEARVAITPIPVAEQIQAVSDRSGARSDEELITLWIDRYESPHTQRAYRGDVSLFTTFLQSLPIGGTKSRPARPKRLADVKVAHLTAFAEELRKSAVSSHARRISSIKSLLTFGHQTGYLTFNVGAAVKPPRRLDHLAERILTPEQVQRLIESCRPGRDRALMRFLYVSGARVSEASGLRWKHVHRDGGRLMVTIHGKGRRTRHIPLPASLSADLDVLEKSRLSTFVFESRGGKRFAPKDIWKLTRAAARKAGIRLSVSPHWLRHAHATHALRRGAPLHVVQQTLGHTSLQTTSRYVHVEKNESSAMFLAV